MNGLFFITAILFVFAGLLLGSVLIYKPKTEAETIFTDIFPQSSQEEERDLYSYKEVMEEKIEQLYMMYPSLKVMTDIRVLEHGILVFYKGVSKHRDYVVFTSHRHEIQDALFKMIERITDENIVCEYGCCIASSMNMHTDLFDLEVVEYFKNQGTAVKGILYDGSHNDCLKKNGVLTPLVGIANGLYLHMEVVGNNRRIIQFGEGFRSLTFENHKTDTLVDIVRRMDKMIPWMIRFELFFMPKKGLKDLAIYMPYTKRWMVPELAMVNSTVTLKTSSAAMFEEAFEKLNALAAQNSVYLKKNEIVEPARGCYENDWIAVRVSESAGKVFERDALAIQVNDNGKMNFGLSDYKSCQYTPVNRGREFDTDAAVEFYRNVISG